MKFQGIVQTARKSRLEKLSFSNVENNLVLIDLSLKQYIWLPELKMNREKTAAFCTHIISTSSGYGH
jgi:hypothetical protein